MFSIKAMLWSALLAAFAAMALVVPAHAEVKASCVIVGSVKMQEKGAPPGVGVQLVGGHGDYTFASLEIACSGSEKGVPAAVSVDVVSDGYYDNIICGTGQAVSPRGNTALTGFTDLLGSSTKGAAFYGFEISKLAYKIQFAGFNGPIHTNADGGVGKDTAKVEPLPDDKGPGLGEPTSESGVISIEPPLSTEKTPHDPVPGECVKAFHVQGDVKIVLPID